jgi:hypothetical protein
MPFRPRAAFRQNISGVVLPLTAAIARLYGVRGSDGAYPLGAFYTENIDRRVWLQAGGIWYQPISPERVQARRISEVRIQQFMEGILTGVDTRLSNGTTVAWELLPDSVAQELPPFQ